MSWNITFIGYPDKIQEALKNHSETLSGDSKKEFDAALPHLSELVGKNYNKGEGMVSPVLKLNAYGHAYDSTDGTIGHGNLGVALAPLDGSLV